MSTNNLLGFKYTLDELKKLCVVIKDSFLTSGCSDINLFGSEALIAGNKYGKEWLDELLKYIGDNFYLSTII